MNTVRTIISGSGSYIPPQVKCNESFGDNEFFDSKQGRIPSANVEIVEKFRQITGIYERRYADNNQNTSGMAAIAGERAIADAGIDPETLDQIIVAHNFGDIDAGSIQSDATPSLAARVKHILGIRNTACIAYDILFGCPGWLQGVIQADAFIKAGVAKKCLVIGAETLSRVLDPHDRDSMIFSDGAGAVVVEARESPVDGSGILSSCARTFTVDETRYIDMGHSNDPEADQRVLYIKMQGRKVYEFALKHLPGAIKACIDDSGTPISAVKKIFIHQANEKLDEAIVSRLYKLYDLTPDLPGIMPMNIHTLGNSSVATIPTLYDMVRKGGLPEHQVSPGDVVVFASVGAGMHMNAVTYRV